VVSLCLSRACLGKTIVLIYKWLKDAVFRSACAAAAKGYGFYKNNPTTFSWSNGTNPLTGVYFTIESALSIVLARENDACCVAVFSFFFSKFNMRWNTSVDLVRCSHKLSAKSKKQTALFCL